MCSLVPVVQRFCSHSSMAQPSSSSIAASSDPSSQPAASSPPQDPNILGEGVADPSVGGAQGAAQDLRAFCREALYECITEEKPGSLPSYLLLYSLMRGLVGGSNTPGTHTV